MMYSIFCIYASNIKDTEGPRECIPACKCNQNTDESGTHNTIYYIPRTFERDAASLKMREIS